MAEISRSALFKRLSPHAFRALESAHAFCRLRENPYVELTHWLHQILQAAESDLGTVIDDLRIDRGRVQSELEDALEKLPRGATSVMDFSVHLENVVERAFVFSSLLFQANNVRTSHLLVAILKTPSLTNLLKKASPTLAGIHVDGLTDRLTSMASLEGDAEEAAAGSGGHAPISGGSASGSDKALDKYCKDMTAAARNGELDRIVGRDQEIRQLIDILMRRRQNNPILTGEAGVGKTAVVEGLAGRIADDDVPSPLLGVRLLALDVGALSAGASLKGEFEKRLKQVIEDVQASVQPIIMFIDEAHTLIGAGGAQGTGDAANLLKPALARGELRTVAATTWAEYKKYIEKDPALTRRFQVVKVDEPDDENAIAMMRAISGLLEDHHKVRIRDEALEASVILSRRYIADRQLPDKSVSLLDTVCARVALSQSAIPARVEASERFIAARQREGDILEREESLGDDHGERLAQIHADLEGENATLAALKTRWSAEKKLVDDITALEHQLTGGDDDASGEEVSETAEKAGEISQEEAKAPIDRAALTAALKAARRELEALQGEDPLILPTVDAGAIAQVVADWTGVPLGRMVKDEMATVLNLTDILKTRVVGQDQGLGALTKRIQTSRAGLSDPNKPVGVFMLCGPSGVGKTETALALAENLYGGEHNLITLNMSEFQEKHTVSTLKGAPPGYVGYGEGGKLTEAVRRKPYSVVLLDEVEKAHPDVHEVFFQVFDKGMMEDGEGRLIDFKNTLIILTSNVGSEELMRIADSNDALPELETVQKALRPALLQTFPAALLGRMIITPYYPLSDDVLRKLITMRLDKVVARVESAYDASLTYDDNVVATILDRCQERESGGRVIDAILTNTVLPKLSSTFLGSKLDGKRIADVILSVEGGDFTYTFK